MAGLVFYFESADVDVWSGKNLDAWNYAAQAAGDITRMIVVNKTDQVLRTPDAGLEDFRVVQELPLLRNAAYFVGPGERKPSTVPLWSFPHDVDWYVFGPAAGWPRPFDRTVTVPQAGLGALHAVHVATTALLHRYAVKHQIGEPWLRLL